MIPIEQQYEILTYCLHNNIRVPNLEFYFTDPGVCYCYAIDILKGRFELAEPIISKDSNYSYLYAENVLKSRFKLGEEAIVREDILWEEYQKRFIFKKSKK